MKKLTALLLAALLLCSCAAAEVVPPTGMGQIGYSAVVLCQTLTVRKDRNTSSKAVATLRWGDVFATSATVDGWCDCYLHENQGLTGWVKAEYVTVDPAWYLTKRATTVCAWNDDAAAHVGLLDAGERYPILKAEGEWVLIGLRGAAGWIHDAEAAAAAAGAMFRPEQVQSLVRADVMAPDGKVYTLTDPMGLAWIESSFSIAERCVPSACPFDGMLLLTRADGLVIDLEMATDSCRIFRAQGDAYYVYGSAAPDETAEIALTFWRLFGLDAKTFYQ